MLKYEEFFKSIEKTKIVDSSLMYNNKLFTITKFLEK